MPKIEVFSTTWCGDCRNLKRQLDATNVEYEEIDIDSNNDAALKVIDWSGGRRVIPTVRISAESGGKIVILHNPKFFELWDEFQNLNELEKAV